jgi:hypothetical protein
MARSAGNAANEAPRFPALSSDIRVPIALLPATFEAFAALRAFSRMLRLSPFTLDRFVDGLLAPSPSYIMDEIFTSILRLLLLNSHAQALFEADRVVVGRSTVLPATHAGIFVFSLFDTLTWPEVLRLMLEASLAAHAPEPRPVSKLRPAAKHAAVLVDTAAVAAACLRDKQREEFCAKRRILVSGARRLRPAIAHSASDARFPTDFWDEGAARPYDRRAHARLLHELHQCEFHRLGLRSKLDVLQVSPRHFRKAACAKRGTRRRFVHACSRATARHRCTPALNGSVGLVFCLFGLAEPFFCLHAGGVASCGYCGLWCCCIAVVAGRLAGRLGPRARRARLP